MLGLIPTSKGNKEKKRGVGGLREIAKEKGGRGRVREPLTNLVEVTARILAKA